MLRRYRARVVAVVAALPLTLAARLPAAEAKAAIADRAAEVDALFLPYARTDAPGCALGIFQNGHVAYAKGYGMANLELHVAISPQTAFDIGSLAKQFTAFSILLLERDGRIALDDAIRKYIPELPGYAGAVTIRHLLHHTGGLRDYIEMMGLGGIRTEDLTTERDALDVLSLQQAPLFPPGSEHLYSNTGYFLLSVIVERASGKSLRDFAHERIFEPLGMRHTQYNNDHTRVIVNRATGYSPMPRDGFAVDMSDFEQNGDGGLWTTIEDLFRWDQNFASPRVGDRKLLDEMESPGTLTGGKPLDYAAGLRLEKYRGLRTIGHTGAWAGYRSLMARFPDQMFTIACLCNRSGIDRTLLMHKLAVIYLGDLLEKEPVPPVESSPSKIQISASELSSLAGAYRDPKSGATWFLAVKNGSLVADAQGQLRTFDPIAPDRFGERDGKLQLQVSPARSGKRRRLEARREGEAPLVLEPIDVWSPTPTQLAEFSGTYASEEVPGLIRFAVAGGRLVLRHRVFPSDPWKPTLPDSFVWEDLSATFTRDRGDRVTGLRLDAGQMRGIVFHKMSS
jgi:CubicO group peptidase (beta-lactamase class C family)